jgi:hypothetical protein
VCPLGFNSSRRVFWLCYFVIRAQWSRATRFGRQFGPTTRSSIFNARVWVGFHYRHSDIVGERVTAVVTETICPDSRLVVHLMAGQRYGF